MEAIICSSQEEINSELESKALLTNWELRVKAKAKYCLASDCLERDNLVGIKVQKHEGTPALYIIPVCLNHAKANETIQVEEYTQLVPFEQ